MIDPTLKLLLADYGDANFDCGAHDPGDSIPYKDLVERVGRSKDFIAAHIETNYTRK